MGRHMNHQLDPSGGLTAIPSKYDKDMEYICPIELI